MKAGGLPTCSALHCEHQVDQVHHTKRDLDAKFAVLWSICHGETSMSAVDPRRDTNGRYGHYYPKHCQTRIYPVI